MGWLVIFAEEYWFNTLLNGTLESWWPDFVADFLFLGN